MLTSSHFGTNLTEIAVIFTISSEMINAPPSFNSLLKRLNKNDLNGCVIKVMLNAKRSSKAVNNGAARGKKMDGKHVVEVALHVQKLKNLTVAFTTEVKTIAPIGLCLNPLPGNDKPAAPLTT